MDYSDIERVNAGLSGIDVKGKNYVMVPQRVKAFRMLYPQGFIKTEMISLADGVCVMRSKAGYYDNGQEIILGTGMAYEKETSSFINKTSYIENCETSSVGRCLGFLGLGIEGGGICSAEELANAISNQGSPAQVRQTVAPKAEAKAEVTTSAKVPKAPTTAKEYVANELVFMGELFGIPDKTEMLEKFGIMRKKLIEGKVIPDIPSDQQTMEQARNMIEAIYANFKPSGDTSCKVN